MFGLASTHLGSSIEHDGRLVDVLLREYRGTELDSVGTLTRAAGRVAEVARAGVGIIGELWGPQGLVLRLPAASRVAHGACDARNTAASSRCCERQLLDVCDRVFDYPVDTIRIYGTEPPCGVCARRLYDAAILRRWTIEYYSGPYPEERVVYSPRSAPTGFRPPRRSRG